MAFEEIADALVRVRVDDGNAVQEVAGIVEAIKGELAKLASTRGVNVGEDIVQGIGPATQELGELLFQIQKIIGLGPTFREALDSGNFGKKALANFDQLVQRAEQLLNVTRQVEAAQAKATAGPRQGDVVEERERLRAAREAQAGPRPTSLDIGGAAGPGGIGNLQTAIDRIEARIKAVDPGPSSQYSKLEELQARFVVAEESMLNARVAQNEGEAQADKKYAAAKAQFHSSGLALLKELQRLQEEEVQAQRQATQSVAASPRRALLQASNEEFLKSRGIDITDTSGSGSLRSKQLELQLKENEAATAAVAAKAAQVLPEEEVAKLTAEKLKLANREISLRRQIAAAQEQEARQARGDGGFLGGVFGKNKDNEGFGGSFGFQAGITLKYYALYSAFAAGQRIIEGLLETTRLYTDQVNQLSIALDLNQKQAEEVATTYQNVGQSFGIDPLKATESAVKFIRSFRDQQGDVNAGAGEAGARIGGIVFTLEPDDHAKQTIQDLIAVAKAYHLGASAAEDAYDKILQVAQFYGYQSAGEVTPGVAAIADIGKESGYNIQQLAALVASVMQQTGVGSDAAAGDIKRFLGSQNEPGILRLFQQQGISSDLTLQQKISQLTDKLATLPDEQRSQILTGVGSPRIAAAVAAAISGELVSRRAADKATDPERLTAADQAQKRLSEFSGALQVFGSKVQELFIEIARSGVLDVLGLVVKAGTSLLNVINETLSLYNNLNPVLKDVLGAFVALYAISKAQAFFRGSGAAAEGAGAISRFALGFGENATPLLGGAKAAQDVQQAQVQRGLALATGQATAALAEETAVQRGLAGSVVTAVTGIRGLVLALAPLATVIAGVMVVSSLIDASNTYTNAASSGDKARGDVQKAAGVGDIDAMKAGVEQIKQSRKELDEGRNWLLDYFRGTNDIDAWKAAQDAFVKNAEAKIAALEKARAELTASSPVSQFFGRNYTDVQAGVELLQDKGVAATGVTNAIDDIIRNASPAIRGSFIQPGEGQKGLPDLVRYVMSRISNTGSPGEQRAGYSELHNVLENARRQAVSEGDDFQVEAIRQQMDQVDKAWSGAIVKATTDRINALKRRYTGEDSATKIRAELNSAFADLAKTGDVQALAQVMSQADDAFLDQYMKGIEAQAKVLNDQAAALAAAAAAAQQPPEDKWKLPGASAGLLGLGGGNLPKAQSDAAKSAATDINKVVDTLKEARGIADATGDATTKLADELDAAKARAGARSGDALSQAKAAVAAAQIRASRAIKNTAEWFDAQQALEDAIYSQSQAQTAFDVAKLQANLTSGDKGGAAVAAVQAAQKQLDQTYQGTTEYYTALKGLHDSQRALAEYNHQVASAIRQANVIPGDPLSQAKAELNQAREDLKFAKDSQDYYAALKSLREAQYQLSQVELQMVQDRLLLSIDITDPVANARARVAEAGRKLEYDRHRGASQDVLLQDEVALRQSRSDAAGAAWQQQFQDQQTNYQLQRTSLTAYLSYLRSQHDYLTAVHNKTRQQVDELNQVDQALKSLTDSMQGQWNLGDIKVPTAYEMRRAVAAGVGTMSTTTVNVNFYGSAEAEMRGALTAVLGQPVLQSVGTAPPRVS